MPSVSIPCPTCSTQLLLDEENAGKEVLCPGCDARLKLPVDISESARPTVVTPKAATEKSAKSILPEKSKVTLPTKKDSDATPLSSPSGPKSALPEGRSKSKEEEIKRLAGAASAPGSVNAFHPEEAAALPAERPKTILPTRRVVDAAVDETPVTSPATDSPATSRPPSVLPTRRAVTPTPDSDGASSPARPLDPIAPRGDVEMGASPLRGPSRFVRPETAPVPPAPEPEPDAEFNDATTSEEQLNDGSIKRGFRLGAARSLHFSPVHSPDTEAEAAGWGSPQLEDPVTAARSRRFVSLALLIVLLGLGGLGIYGLRLAFQKPAEEPTAPGSGTASATTSEDVMRNVEDARKVLDRFLAADSIDKLAAEVRHPDITRPRMERWYGNAPIKPRKKRAESQSWSEIRIENTEFIRAAWELDDFRVYAITLELIPGGEPKVDWESFVNWSEIAWKDFLKTPPEQSVEFRVSVTYHRDDLYYNYYSKGQELELMCFKLEDPEKYGSCWAYCHKDSEAASMILFNLKRARQQGQVNADGKVFTSCILKLRFPPEGMKSNQVLIEKFVHDSWVLP